MNNSPAFHIGYLRGMLDGEGSVLCTAQQYRIQISNTDITLIRAIRQSLKFLGISYRLNGPYNSKGRWKPIYYINIKQRDAFLKFAHVVGCTAVHKLKVLKQGIAYHNRPDRRKYKPRGVPSRAVLERLYLREKRSIREIAEKLGYKSGGNVAVGKYMKQCGIPLRSRSEELKLRWAAKRRRRRCQS